MNPSGLARCPLLVIALDVRYLLALWLSIERSAAAAYRIDVALQAYDLASLTNLAVAVLLAVEPNPMPESKARNHAAHLCANVLFFD